MVTCAELSQMDGTGEDCSAPGEQPHQTDENPPPSGEWQSQVCATTGAKRTTGTCKFLPHLLLVKNAPEALGGVKAKAKEVSLA